MTTRISYSACYVPPGCTTDFHNPFILCFLHKTTYQRQGSQPTLAICVFWVMTLGQLSPFVPWEMTSQHKGQPLSFRIFENGILYWYRSTSLIFSQCWTPREEVITSSVDVIGNQQIEPRLSNDAISKIVSSILTWKIAFLPSSLPLRLAAEKKYRELEITGENMPI